MSGLGNGKNHLLDPACIFIKGESTHHVLHCHLFQDEFGSFSHPFFCEIYVEVFEKSSQTWEVDLSWNLGFNANIFAERCEFTVRFKVIQSDPT